MLTLNLKIRKVFLSLVATLGIIVGFAFQSYATHTAAIEITYRHVSGTNYEFTVVFYRNCLGSTATAPSSISLIARSASLGISNHQITPPLFQVPGSGTSPANMYNCTTAPLCYQEYEYRGQINLATINPSNYKADDWIFYYQLCCTPSGAIAPENIGYGSLYAECGLNNKDFPAGDNDAPFWHEARPVRPGYTNDTVISYPIKSVCEGNRVILDQRVTEYEGDLLRYELINPLDANGMPATYISPFSLSFPLPFQTPPGFEIDSANGTIEFIPAAVGSTPAPGIYVVAIKATEIRIDTQVIGGTPVPVPIEIGHIIRHLTIIVEPAATCPDNNISLNTSANNNIHLDCGDTSFVITVSKKFQCASADTDGSFVEIKQATTGSVVPVQSVDVVDCWNNWVATKFRVNLFSPLNAGNYYMTLKTGTDGNTLISECGNEITAFDDTVSITADSIGPAKILGSPDTLGGYLPYLEATCGQTSFTIYFDEQIRCSSIDPAGSDFVIIDSSGASPVVNPVIALAIPVNCKGDLTNSINFTLTPAIDPGEYTIVMKSGTDGNTVLNKCGEASITVNNSKKIKVPELELDLGPDLQYCKDSIFQAYLEAPPGYFYQWSTGQSGQGIIVITKGTYILNMQNVYGCAVIDSVVVQEIDCSVGIAKAEASQLEMYPNPSGGMLYVHNTGADRAIGMKLLSMEGKEVWKTELDLKPGETVPIDLSGMAKGIYFVRLSEQGSLLRTERIILE